MEKGQEVQNEIDKTKAKIMYDELIIKYKYIKDFDNEENTIKKIIELKLNEESIKKYYDNIQRIYEYLENNYELSSFVEKDIIINKIKELHCNKESICEWADDVLING